MVGLKIFHNIDTRVLVPTSINKKSIDTFAVKILRIEIPYRSVTSGYKQYKCHNCPQHLIHAQIFVVLQLKNLVAEKDKS